MNVEELREYCLQLQQVTEDTPFGEDVLVFKIAGKMFCFTALDREDLRINLKCEPDEAIEMREMFPSVQPGFHMNKRHWNTIIIDGTVSDSMLKKWIEKSYRLVISGLPKKERSKYPF